MKKNISDVLQKFSKTVELSILVPDYRHMKKTKADIKKEIQEVLNQINAIAADGGMVPWNDPLELKLKNLRKQLAKVG